MKPHSFFALLLIAVSVLAISLTGASSASRTDRLTVSSSIDGSKLDDQMTLSGQVTWTASSGGTPNRIEFLIDGSSKWTDPAAPYQFGGDPAGRFDTTSLPDGQHKLTVKAYRDAGNNHATSMSVRVTIANGKNPPPPPPSSFAVTSSIANGATLSGSLMWTATPSGTTVSSVDFLVDGTVKWTENISPYEFNGDGGKLDTTTLSNGAHTLALQAHAADGRTATSSSAVTVANGTTPPPSSFVVTSSIVNGATLTGSLTWTATPSGTTVSSVDFLIDGTVKWTENISPYEFNGDGGKLDTTTLSNGAHTLSVEAHAADGRSATASSAVTITNGPAPAPPSFVVTSSIADGATIGGSMVWTATASGDTFSKVEFLVDGTTKWTDQVAPYQFGGDPAGRFDTTTLTNGQHRLAVTAYGTGGLSVTDLASVTVSNGAPSTTAPGSVLWAGNYETGDFSQYWLHEWSINNDQGFTANQVGHSSATIVTSPVRQGRYAAKFQVFPTTGTNPNDRAFALATQAQSGGYPGQEWWYGWWTMFPGPTQQWWSLGGDWNLFTTFFSTDNVSEQIHLGINATVTPPNIYVAGIPLGKRTLAELQYDHWYHFLVHAKWSIDPAVGLMEIFVDGVNVVPLTHGATLRDQHSPAIPDWTSPGMHLAQGIYRGAFSSTNTVIHDGLCRADSYSAAADC